MAEVEQLSPSEVARAAAALTTTPAAASHGELDRPLLVCSSAGMGGDVDGGGGIAAQEAGGADVAHKGGGGAAAAAVSATAGGLVCAEGAAASGSRSRPWDPDETEGIVWLVTSSCRPTAAVIGPSVMRRPPATAAGTVTLHFAVATSSAWPPGEVFGLRLCLRPPRRWRLRVGCSETPPGAAAASAVGVMSVCLQASHLTLETDGGTLRALSSALRAKSTW